MERQEKIVCVEISYNYNNLMLNQKQQTCIICGSLRFIVRASVALTGRGMYE